MAGPYRLGNVDECGSPPPEGYSGVILKPFQYSSFNRNDPNSAKFLHANDPAWQQCLAVAQDVSDAVSGSPTQTLLVPHTGQSL